MIHSFTKKFPGLNYIIFFFYVVELELFCGNRDSWFFFFFCVCGVFLCVCVKIFQISCDLYASKRN